MPSARPTATERDVILINGENLTNVPDWSVIWSALAARGVGVGATNHLPVLDAVERAADRGEWIDC